MKIRAFWLNVALGALVGAIPLEGCSAPDPGLVTFSSAPGHQARGGTGDAGGASGGGMGSPGGGTTPDAGGSPTSPATAFTGAPIYATAISGGDTLNANHNFAGATPTTNPVGQPCLDCHGPAGGAGTKFAFGGSVFSDVAGTQAAAGVEIRVRDSAGNFMVTHSDGNGNFYAAIATGGPQPITAGALAGTRDATGNVSTMTPPLAGATAGSCNATGCHGGAAPKIHVP